jgi:hypothetical protein
VGTAHWYDGNMFYFAVFNNYNLSLKRQYQPLQRLILFAYGLALLQPQPDLKLSCA